MIGGNSVVKIVNVLSVGGEKYVPLESYQEILRELERLQLPKSNAEILAEIIARGEIEEVYDG